MSLLMLAPPSSSAYSFRLCLLLVALATFCPPTTSSRSAVHAFVINKPAPWTSLSRSSNHHKSGAHFFNTQLASSTVKDDASKAKKDKKLVKTVTTSSSASSLFDFFKTTTATTSVDNTVDRSSNAASSSNLQKRQFINTDGMTNFIQALQESTSMATTTTTTTPTTDEVAKAAAASPSLDTVLKVAVGVLVSLIAVAIYSMGWTMTDVTTNLQMLVTNPQEILSTFISSIQDLGPVRAPLYFGIMYFLAELLAVPATPLTLSAGYLLGLPMGSVVVLTSAVAAACVSFFIGKTVLRGAVQEILDQNPKWAKLDEALGSGGTTGFKLLLLVRLTPLFPFSIANYIYGASAIDFRSYFFATLLGFAPGTVAYVYTGMVGQALTSGGGDDSQPWFVYMGGLVVLAGLLKLATDVATNVIETMGVNDDDDNDNNNNISM